MFSSSFTLPIPQPCLSRLVIASSFVRRSRSRRRRSKRNNKLKLSDPTTIITTFSEPKLETVIDLSVFPSFHSNIRQFVSSGKEAYRDLQTLLTLDDNRRVIISCRPSTLHFLGTSAALTIIAFSVLRVFFELVSRFASWRRNASTYNNNNKGIMLRRDRSLGGKEVVVGLSTTTAPSMSIKRSFNNNNNKVVSQRKLPKWWPPINNPNAFDIDLNHQDEYKRDAYRLVRGLSFLLPSFLPFYIFTVMFSFMFIESMIFL